MSNGVNQCAACGGLWDDDEPHVACRSDHGHDPTDEAVALLKSIGLDITYTDEGLRVVAEQIGRLYGSTPRTITADDPEPAVGSVVLDGNGRAWQRTYVHAWCTYGVGGWTDWESMLRLFAPFTLIHDGEA